MLVCMYACMYVWVSACVCMYCAVFISDELKSKSNTLFIRKTPHYPYSAGTVRTYVRMYVYVCMYVCMTVYRNTKELK